ncbi:hypothetical protein Q8F55_001481 [Vanrija albida]|uniref:Uncharacterized protein n=1 Tax=Vanrija albida TaxID=181172 RepID=A0ABR3QG77_9TREE
MDRRTLNLRILHRSEAATFILHRSEAATFVALLNAVRAQSGRPVIDDTHYLAMWWLSPRLFVARRLARHTRSGWTAEQRARVIAVDDGDIGPESFTQCVAIMLDTGVICLREVGVWIARLHLALDVVVAIRCLEVARMERMREAWG